MLQFIIYNLFNFRLDAVVVFLNHIFRLVVAVGIGEVGYNGNQLDIKKKYSAYNYLNYRGKRG